MTPGAYTAIAFFVVLLLWIAWEIWRAPSGDQYGGYDSGVDEWEDEA